MDITRETLDIFFRRIQPELLLEHLRQAPSGTWNEDSFSAFSQTISRDTFKRYGSMALVGFTSDEIDNIYQFAQQRMKRTGPFGPSNSIFYLLVRYTDHVLTEKGGEPQCKAGHLLDWRSISFRLGVDLFVTAALAWNDQRFGKKREWFDWPPILRCDDPRLEVLRQQGRAENHYHLHGSTRSMQLSWVNLMNHPEQIDRYFQDRSVQKHFQQNLNPNLLMSANERQLEWNLRLRYACWFRILLFRRCFEEDMPKNVWDTLWDPFQSVHEVQEYVSLAQYQYGHRFRQSNGQYKYLDYAISHRLAERHSGSFNRILTGERALLYHCFYHCFSGGFSSWEQDVFYIYLLLKSNFRSELVQVNRDVGFHNFSRYQDRKNDFFRSMPEYFSESLRLSVSGAMSDSRITSLEARVMPAERARDLYSRLSEIDREVLFSQNCRFVSRRPEDIEAGAADLKHFYVLHFAKKKLEKEPDIPLTGLVYPRNSEVRRLAQKQALALAEACSAHNWICTRVRGIDACSTEIGCRPETFAVAYRFLRGYVPLPRRRRRMGEPPVLHPRLSASYHAGEDFLDLADGLRAIDEAISFLHLKRGDRIGHALALGIAPQDYYRKKRYQITLPEQDRLDDLVWLLFRSLELGVDMPSMLRSELTREATQLLHRIYDGNFEGAAQHPDLQDYYIAWSHRGDHPSLYWNIAASCEREENASHSHTLADQFGMFYQGNKMMCSELQKRILHAYHYGKAAREAGQEITNVLISEQYAQFIRQMQDSLQCLMADRGIAVECNPSSNFLISTLDRYAQHPIFRFNRYGLDGATSFGSELSVSVNTDDQGVFDTSLENEYALLASALAKQTDLDGKRIYGDDAIYCYLNHLQELGKAQVFPPATLYGATDSTGLSPHSDSIGW